jgi:asparagine synthetase B (glutamine-hydrolysing)
VAERTKPGHVRTEEAHEPRPIAPELRPRPLEVATGWIFGPAPSDPGPPGASPLEAVGTDTARDAIELVVLDALLHPPCVVSFSGGRDSSALLAVATLVARREGLPEPVPVTLRFPSVGPALENQWQQRVVDHLALDDWVRIEVHDELDVVGPVAERVMRRHGLVWPFNAHFHVPIFEHAAGGSLVAGVGGDEIFAVGRLTDLSFVLRGRARPTVRDARALALLALPRRARAAVLRKRRRLGDLFEWLTCGARSEIERLEAAERATEPLEWADWICDRWWGSRTRAMTGGIFDALAADVGARAVLPFADGDVLGALAHQWGPLGFRGRTDAMRALFGDLLPPDVLSRASKASFDPAFWNRHSRGLVAAWDGSGIPAEIVDASRLLDVWHRGAPPAQSFALAQAVFMHEAGLPAGGMLTRTIT